MNTFTKLTTFDTDELSDEVRREANAYKKAAQAIREYRHMTMRIDLANRILERVHGIITGNMPVYLYGYDDNKVNLETIPFEDVPLGNVVIFHSCWEDGGWLIGIKCGGRSQNCIKPGGTFTWTVLENEQVVDTGVKING